MQTLDQPDVKDTLHKLHGNYVLVPADKAANNVIIVCQKYFIDTLAKELGINNVNISNPTYIPIDDSFETHVNLHVNVNHEESQPVHHISGIGNI